MDTTTDRGGELVCDLADDSRLKVIGLGGIGCAPEVLGRERAVVEHRGLIRIELETCRIVAVGRRIILQVEMDVAAHEMRGCILRSHLDVARVFVETRCESFGVPRVRRGVRIRPPDECSHVVRLER